MTSALHTVAQVQALEADLAARGLSAPMLMARAGDALLRCVRANWPEARRILVVAGPGNNGGDGYVLARLIGHRSEANVCVLALTEPRAIEAKSAADAWRAAGGSVDTWRPGYRLPAADLIVDALFGIGLTRALGGDAGLLVDAINAHGAPVLAVDLPSGMNADTGSHEGAVVRATRTLCLLARKRGLHTGRAVDSTGAIVFDDLGVAADGINVNVDIDDETVDDVGEDFPEHGRQFDCILLERRDLHGHLRPRRRGAHKGDNGHVLVIGGNIGMAGAVIIAGHAALRAGAGWASIATREAHAALSDWSYPELMRHGVEDAGALASLLQRADALAVGPGMGTGEWSRTLFNAALVADMPSVLDADALNLLAKSPRPLGRRVILTPHPGEAARLLDMSIDVIERDRYSAARALSRRYYCVVVLKGAGTIIDDGERCAVCPFGNPGMASAGMGDALSGVIAAFLAQGMSAWNAATAGVLAHALAGDAAAHAGERGLLASDLIDQLRSVVNP